MDARIVEDLRNFLFDSPVAMDLAAINIERGRDLGLGTPNQTRQAIGLTPYTNFAQITDDAATVAALRTAFGNVNAIDLWTGGLSEASASGALVGETFQRIIAAQFTSLRDGDRAWYQNQGFDAKTLNTIEHTTLSDIIRRNTDTTNLQDDAFMFYERHSGMFGGGEPERPDAPQLVIGSDGGDGLTGGDNSDVLVAGSGRQTLIGVGGADKLIGGTGHDVAAFSQSLSHYTLRDLGGYITVSGPDGDDTLFDIEQLRFSDGTINAAMEIRCSTPSSMPAPTRRIPRRRRCHDSLQHPWLARRT